MKKKIKKKHTFINKRLIKDAPVLWKSEIKLTKLIMTDGRMSVDDQHNAAWSRERKYVSDINEMLNDGVVNDIKLTKLDLNKVPYESIEYLRISQAVNNRFSKCKNEGETTIDSYFKGIKNEDYFILNDRTRRVDAAIEIQKRLKSLVKDLNALKFKFVKNKLGSFLTANLKNSIFISVLNPDDIEFIKGLDITSSNNDQFNEQDNANVKCQYPFCEIAIVDNNLSSAFVDKVTNALNKNYFQYQGSFDTSIQAIKVTSVDCLNSMGPGILV